MRDKPEMGDTKEGKRELPASWITAKGGTPEGSERGGKGNEREREKGWASFDAKTRIHRYPSADGRRDGWK